MDTDLLKFFVEHLWVPLVGALGYQQIRRDKRMDTIEEKIEKDKDDLAQYKHLVSTSYATHENVREVKDDLKYVRQGVDDIRKYLLKNNSG